MTRPVERPDLADRKDVDALVRAFYGRAFADSLLGPVFIDIARMDLRAHLPIMCDFWETVLFRAGLYRRNAFAVHVDLHRRAGLTGQHFDRWLELWDETVDGGWAGPVAVHAKVQAARIAESIHRRLNSRIDTQPKWIGSRPTGTGLEAGGTKGHDKSRLIPPTRTATGAEHRGTEVELRTGGHDDDD